VGVDLSVSVEEAHKIAEAVEKRVAGLAAQSDVVVHVNPVQQIDESLPQTARAIGNQFGLLTHNIHAHEVMGEYYLDLDIEVPRDLTLEEAHKRVSDYEDALAEELPQLKEINTHIEPLTEVSLSTPENRFQTRDQFRAQVLELANRMPDVYLCHNVRIWPEGDGYDVVLHCHADPYMPIVEAHHLAEQLKQEIMAQVPGVNQVLVHMEPGEVEDEEGEED
jgi:divalent metal cation (Fe/Co/Zn/Cd) transporter